MRDKDGFDTQRDKIIDDILDLLSMKKNMVDSDIAWSALDDLQYAILALKEHQS